MRYVFVKAELLGENQAEYISFNAYNKKQGIRLGKKKKCCVYCGKEKKLTREHVISKGVLKIIFGEDINNRVVSPMFKNGELLNHQQTIKDVCGDCNSGLSNYDVAGAGFIEALYKIKNISGSSIPFNMEILGWFLKTHCNVARAGKVKNDQTVLTDIIRYSNLPFSKFRFYICGVMTTPEQLDEIANGDFTVIDQWCLPDKNHNIALTHLRFKILDTFMAFSMNENYSDFEERISSAMEKPFNQLPYEVDCATSINQDKIDFPFEQETRRGDQEGDIGNLVTLEIYDKSIPISCSN